MSEIIVSTDQGDTKFEEDVSSHWVDGRWIELIAEGRDTSVFVRLDKDEAYELGLKLLHYAFTHGREAQP